MLDHLTKALPPLEEPHLEEVEARNWNALGGDLLFPVLVIRDSALRHNMDVMGRFCGEHGVSLAPHGKTTMSPELIRRQLEAGAWAITAATPAQARAMRAFGGRRIMIANQVPDRLGLRWMAADMAANPDVEIYSLVDSVALVRLMEEAVAGSSPSVQLPVLVEMGLEGGRTGCRSRAQAHEVAAAVRDARWLRLAGVEAFEGVIGHDSSPGTLASVDGLLTEVRLLTEEMAAEGAFSGAPEIVVSAGGSTYFDRVVQVLAAPWRLRRPVRVVLRSGCYLTHDHVMYRRGSPFGGRLADWPPLQPALELWGLVQSRPEPELAILGFGKRDASYDAGLPVPVEVRHDGSPRPAPAGMEIFRLNDQHAFCRLAPDDPLQVGDLVGCGLSHPCTVFDKWRTIPVVDDGYRVIEVVETYF